MRLFLICGVIALVNLFSSLEKRNYLPRHLFGLSSLTFFIYVIHEIYIINWLKGFFYKLPVYESGWVKIICYFIIPILCVAICILLFYLFKKMLPRFTAFILGGRSLIKKVEKIEIKYPASSNVK